MKFILRYTASGNEAIMQNKWGSLGIGAPSILHLKALFPFCPPSLSPHPAGISCPLRSLGASHTSFFLPKYLTLHSPCGSVGRQGGVELGKLESQKTRGASPGGESGAN